MSKLPITFATRSTFHAARFWLNEDAPLNVQYMFDTPAVFQSPMGWLKAVAELNIAHILVADATFQAPMGWLKADADSKEPATPKIRPFCTKLRSDRTSS